MLTRAKRACAPAAAPEQWQGSLIFSRIILRDRKAFPLAIQHSVRQSHKITGLLQEKKMSVAQFEPQLDKT
jgi:hypothetical protein